MYEYKDFILEIIRLNKDQYQVHTYCEGIHRTETIKASLSKFKKQDLEEAQTWLRRGCFDDLKARHFGENLFRTIFTSGIEDFLWSVLNSTEEPDRVRILISYPMPEPFNKLPWELLYTERGSIGFFARSSQLFFARYYQNQNLEIIKRTYGFDETTLNVLVIGAEPAGYPPVSTQVEISAIAEPLRKTTSPVEFFKLIGHSFIHRKSIKEVIQQIINRQRYKVAENLNITKAGLVHLLDQQDTNSPVHVIHFIGHGRTDGLLLEPDPEKSDDGWISSSQFAEIVARNEIMLVALSACDSASGTQFLESTAHALLEKGVPVVVGMQSPVLDLVAIEFFREFYAA